ncbi:MAG TPA: hypothetical protein VKB80_34720, partial [Kofleriaceae bacterium]|nr:hypothetical protein [Kofleriaceae bacterium]
HLGYVRHHLIDFGDSLGASGERDKYQSEGYEGEFDWAAMGGRLFGFGLRYQDWLRLRRAPYPSVGIFEADLFEPSSWRPTYPNPAFQKATRADTFWAAAILAHLDRTAITAAVAAAHYSDARAARLIIDVLLARRVKVLRHAFAGILPLADPSVRGLRVAMTDLAVAAGLPGPAGPPRYRFSVRWNRTARGDCELERGERGGPALDLGPSVASARRRFGAAFAADPFVTVTWQRMRGDGPGPRVELHLRVQSEHLIPVAVWREGE